MQRNNSYNALQIDVSRRLTADFQIGGITPGRESEHELCVDCRAGQQSTTQDRLQRGLQLVFRSESKGARLEWRQLTADA
jgi:hypothetical protein